MAKIANLCHNLYRGDNYGDHERFFTNPMKEWVEDQVGGGLYSNTSDYVRDLIRQDQDAQNKRELLVKALQKGEKSGVSKRTLDDIWNEVKASKR